MELEYTEKAKEAQVERSKKTTIAIPLSVWKAVGHLAIEQERNFSDITSEALSLYLWLYQEFGNLCSDRPLSEVAKEIVSEHLKR
jgi:hypothetical protein